MAITQAPTPRPELTVNDFQPEDRIWWDGHYTQQFATVVRIQDGNLVVRHDYCDEEDTIYPTGTGATPGESYIGQWRLLPDVKRIKAGTVLSTFEAWLTWGQGGTERVYFEVISVVPGEKVFLQEVGNEEYEIVLQGDNYSRNLEDALYKWDVESY